MSATCLNPSVPDEAVPRPAGEQPVPLTRRASLNAAASLLDYAARLGVGLVVTPVLVSGLGGALFGVWEVLLRMVGYLSAADGRPTEALRLVISSQQHQEDEDAADRKRRCVGSALGVWLLFLPVMAAAGAVTVWIAPAVTGAPPGLEAPVRWACALLVLNFILANLAALPEAVLRGMNLGHRRMGLQAGLNVLGGVLVVLAVRSGHGIAAVAGAQIVLTLSAGVLFWVVTRRCVSWFGIARPDRKGVRAFLKLSIWSFLGALVARVLLSTDVILLGLLVSSSSVTRYVLTGYASQAILGVLSLALGALAPGIGGLIGERQHGRALLARNESLAVVWLLATASGAAILAWNRSFLQLWTGGHYAGAWENLLIVLMMLQTALIRCDSYVVDAALRLRERVIVSGGAALLTILFAGLLAPRFGIAGVCLGVLCGRMVQVFVFPRLVRSCLETGGSSAPGLALRAGATTAGLFGVAACLGELLLVANWLYWIVGAASTGAAALCLAFLLGLPEPMRRSLARRARMLRPFSG